MSQQKPLEPPLSFDQVRAQERAAIRPGEDASKPSAPLSALCISGGGIRSATFALGVLQGLAKEQLLDKFDYLSTVSGGGYIGSWLTAWKHRKEGLLNIINDLKPSASKPQTGPDPVQHLREYNNYLSPKLGLFSADTWTLVATVTRNMFLNWLVFVPLLLLALMLPRLVLSFARLGETLKDYYGVIMVAHGRVEQILPIVGGLLFAIAVCNAFRYLPGIGGKEHTESDFLKYCFLPLLLAVLAIITLDSWFTGGDQTRGNSIVSRLDYWPLFSWILGSGGIGWAAYLLVGYQKLKEKHPHVFKWILGLSLAIVLTAFSVAGGAWLLTRKLNPILEWPAYVTVAAPLLLIAFGLAVSLFVGFSSTELKDEDREWLARAGGWILLYVVVWTSFSALVLLAPSPVLEIFKAGTGHTNPQLPNWLRSLIASIGMISGVVGALSGGSSKTGTRNDGKKSGKEKSGIGLDLVAKLAAPLFVVVVLVLLAKLTDLILAATRLIENVDKEGHKQIFDWRNHEKLIENTHLEYAVLLALGFFVLAWVMARFININKFSLHAMYRDRLIRAYLGASNPDSKAKTFTGFSESDNLLMSKLVAEQKPFHLVNIALNLVSTKRLAWQQRKATSFTVSALHSGSSDLKYRPSGEYGGKGGISLGTALALSGAAASPNMGYHSSPLLGFIMTLFNARLGAWLGNPGLENSDTWRHEGPHSAIDSLVREAAGLTNDTSPYIYLSDGGHFENLGVYEMIKRGCRYIVVLDAASDPNFIYHDLGNALRKVRIDTKIPIDFDEALWSPLRYGKKRCAVATIRYSDVYPDCKDGVLIYIKPIMLGSEPPDLAAYQAANQTFPHETTANQFFNESQTESYRMLGLHSVIEMCADWNEEAPTLASFEQHVRRTYLEAAAPAAAAAGAGK